ncbi:hypothetical protein O1611_g2822 [Lasiodiplodia mahajangana]|uniref:Uncharacterized protein n=1 Tax=Lasiodiplodia mahajangana TaxID=1108764 RepID=A0ACC2JTH2_9PEZI|nr:hypothetical protein O1611_g2822 [Lasiodiplodia mahajangana]
MERPAKRVHLDDPQQTEQARNRLLRSSHATKALSQEDQQVLRRAAEILSTSITDLPQKIPDALSQVPRNDSSMPPAQLDGSVYTSPFPAAQQADTHHDMSSGLSPSTDFYTFLNQHGVGVSDNCFRLFEPAPGYLDMSDPASSSFNNTQPQFQQGVDNMNWDLSSDFSAPSQSNSNGLQLQLQGEIDSMNWNLVSGRDSAFESWLPSLGPTNHQASRSAVGLGSSSTSANGQAFSLGSTQIGIPASGVPISINGVDISQKGTRFSTPTTPSGASHTEYGSSVTEGRRGSNSSSCELFKSPSPNSPLLVLMAENWLKEPKGPRRRGPYKDRDEREQTGLTRKLGACIRCRIQKARCIPDPANLRGPCLTCKMVTETALSRPICVRKKVTEAKLFAKGEHPQFRWSQRWKSMKPIDIKNWASSEVRTIWVTQDVAGLKYPLRVRKFIPIPGDSLQRNWSTNGVEKHYDCTNYAIENMLEAGRDLEKFVDGSIALSIDYYIDKSDWLLHQTYHMALKHSSESKDGEERSLVRSLLRFWVSLRMESRSERICGSETLGMKPQDYDPECHNYNQVLVPPVMSAQIELIATTTVLRPMSKRALGSLRKLIEKKRTASWFTSYLCIFILLHSCALLTDFERKQAKKYGLESPYVHEEFVEELHNGSNILLSYFHSALKGNYPLRMDWDSSPDAVLAQLTPEQTKFIQESYMCDDDDYGDDDLDNDDDDGEYRNRPGSFPQQLGITMGKMSHAKTSQNNREVSSRYTNLLSLNGGDGLRMGINISLGQSSAATKLVPSPDSYAYVEKMPGQQRVESPDLMGIGAQFDALPGARRAEWKKERYRPKSYTSIASSPVIKRVCPLSIVHCPLSTIMFMFMSSSSDFLASVRETYARQRRSIRRLPISNGDGSDQASSAFFNQSQTSATAGVNDFPF